MPSYSQQIQAASYDTEMVTSTGAMSSTGATLDMGREDVGLHFTDIDIAPGSTIDSAYLEFIANGSDSAAPTITIFGEDIDDAADFATTSYYLDGLTRTTASVAFDSTAWTNGSTYQSPSIVSIVQEIVDRAGWASGNAINFIIEGDSPSARRRARAYNYSDDPTNAPKLVITWTEAGSTYTLTAAQGSFTMTGQAAGLAADRKLTAAQGAYTMTGQSANLSRGYLFTAAHGVYTLTGQAAGLAASRVLTAAQGAYTLTGQSAGLAKGYVLSAAQGAYTLAGQAAGLAKGYVLAAEQGAYTLIGQAATLTKSAVGYILTAAAGAYTLTGQAARLAAGYVLTAAAGIYTLSGQIVNLRTPTATSEGRVTHVYFDDRTYHVGVEGRTTHVRKESNIGRTAHVGRDG